MNIHYLVIFLNVLLVLAAKALRFNGISLPFGILGWFPSFGYAFGICLFWFLIAERYRFQALYGIPPLIGAALYEISQIFDQGVFAITDLFAIIFGYIAYQLYLRYLFSGQG